MKKTSWGKKIEHSSSRSSLDEGNLTTFVKHELDVDGELYEVAYVIEHRDDYRIAEIIEFSVNGEKTDL